MSIVRSITQTVVVALGILSSSVAFARNPPSLVMRQQAAANATRSGGGYRDINYRFGNVPARAPAPMRAAGGYRDINYRFPGACQLPARTASNTSSSRWR